MLEKQISTPLDTPPAAPDTALPAAFLMADQRQRWQRGERVFIESYLEQNGDCCGSTEKLLDLIYHEVIVRERVGDAPTLEEYRQRFPRLTRELGKLFEVHAVLGAIPALDESANSSTGLPEIPGYEIFERLGIGGMGVVYKARQISLDRIVALKMTAQLGASALEARHRLLAEARAVASMHHPHIVQIFEVGDYEGVPYFSMEYIDGGSLAQYLRKGRWPGQLAAAAVECLARTIHVAHLQGLVHRDLKPSNILLQTVARGQPAPQSANPGAGNNQTDGALAAAEPAVAGCVFPHPGPFVKAPVFSLKIADFGLAKLLDAGADRTRSGMVVGTPNYMAPEQVRREAGKVSPATDVHALGVILYEMLTSVTPFRAAGVLETLDQVLHEDPLSLRRLQSGIPRDLETICLKCLRKEPDRRYQSALEMAEDLCRFQAGEPVQARAMGQAERAWKWCRRRPAQAALLASVALFVNALMIGALVANFYLHRARDTAVQAEESALRALRQSYLDQARLGRLNPSAGQRTRSLELLAEAARMSPGLDVRNEAIACLAKADWRPLREWLGNPLLGSVAFDSQVERYVHCEDNGQLTIRAVLDDRELLHLEMPPGGLQPMLMAFGPEDRYLAGTCSIHSATWLVLWDLQSGKEALRLPSAYFGSAFAFAPDGATVATAIRPTTISICEIPSGKERLRLEQVATVDAIAFNAQGTMLALSSPQQKVAEVYDLQTRKRTQRLLHPDGVRGVGWSTNGKLLATGCDDSIAYVWDVATGRLISTLAGHRAPIIWVGFVEGDEEIVTSSWDGTCRWWDLEPRQAVLSAPGSWAYIARSGRRMALVNGERLSVWEKATPEIRKELRPRLASNESPKAGRLGIRSVEITPGGLLAAATEDGVHLWNTTTLTEVELLSLGQCAAARFDPKGQCVAAFGKDGLFRWHCRFAGGTLTHGPREAILPRSESKFAVRDFCWGPGGDYVLFSDIGKGKIFRVETSGVPVVTEFGDLGRVATLAHSPDGRWVAAGTWQGGGLRIWDAKSGVEAKSISGSRPGATSMRAAFSPDGTTLGASGQQEYRFFEPYSWRLQFTLPRERIETSPGPLAFHPAGRLLALVRAPDQVQLLDRTTYRELATLTNPDPVSITNLCFDADGSHLAAGTAMHGLQWWDIKELRAELGRMGLDWED
jgi:eukaryotic-like serine/threonine-protein kinase